ncbi:transglutaminase-like domain-containing protein [Abyssibacter profundi]|nr:transglutaminase family protein [Abyssibacter profundi]
MSSNAPVLSINVLAGFAPPTYCDGFGMAFFGGRLRPVAGADAMKQKNIYMNADTREYLAPGDFVDSEHPDIQDFASNRAGEGNDRQRAIRLYYAIRDEIRYDPYAFSLEPDRLRASTTLAAGRGYCVPKAVLLAACARAAGIPARIGFADVKNHLASQRLLALMQTDIFYYHGYTELWLGGCWIKATPAFNIGLCERFGVKALEFDGREHALMHEFDTAGRRHMQYLTDHGSRDDLPYAELAAAYQKHYPRLLAAPDALSGDMAAEMEQDRAQG